MSATSELIASIFGLRTLLGPVVDEYMRTTSWISFTWFWMRPTWPRRSEVVTLMSAAGPAARGAAISSDGAHSAACGGRGFGARVGCSIIAAKVQLCRSSLARGAADRGKLRLGGSPERTHARAPGVGRDCGQVRSTCIL